MDDSDLALRNTTYALFAQRGRAPTAAEVAAQSAVTTIDVQQGWKRLHAQHALVLDEAGGIRMANPFSAVPTPHRVEADSRSWYANCAWDAFGICAVLGVDGRIDTTCPDCGEPIVVEVRDGRPDDEGHVFHSLVDAAHWWDDIGFT